MSNDNEHVSSTFTDWSRSSLTYFGCGRTTPYIPSGTHPVHIKRRGRGRKRKYIHECNKILVFIKSKK